jgi:hypothetical protein
MCPVLEAPHLGRKPKHGLYKTENNQYVPQLTEEHISLYSSVNRGIYEHVSEEGGGYILQLRVTKEYITLYSLITRNPGI